jgi:queuine tRNA-ribosyltransferase
VVETPAFMPVGTRGSIKGVTPEQVAQTGTQIMLANTYHLHVRPGADTVRALGGLHAFSGWSGPILTDSGGYQVFSLAELNTITDAGVTFRSHVDGAWLHLDAATAIEIQAKLGADIIMAFDECPALPAPRPRIEAAVERTVRWARECRQIHQQILESGLAGGAPSRIGSAGASPSPAGDSAWGAGV